MSDRVQAVYDAAMALPEDERLLLVERLTETLPPPTEEPMTEGEFAAELDRRWAEYQRDPSSAVPWDQVKHFKE
jgi:putative addiction module component (TIGR02574 family)